MADLAQILEEELEEAVEVKNKKSLHRYISLLIENMTRKDENRMEHSEFQKELIRIDGRFNQLITEVREGFRRMDERFEASEKRFNRQTAMMSIGFLVVTTLITIYQFLN